MKCCDRECPISFFLSFFGSCGHPSSSGAARRVESAARAEEHVLHTHRDGRLVSRRSEPYSWHQVRTASLHTSSRERRPAPSRRPKGAPRRASSAERVAQHTRHTAFEWRLTNVFLLLSASISARRFLTTNPGPKLRVSVRVVWYC